MRKSWIKYDLNYMCSFDSKMLGYSKSTTLNEQTELLLQLDYSVGCLHNVSYFIAFDDLKNKNFENVRFGFDMD